MIKKISDWIYLKYGVRVKRKHIILAIILILSIIFLLFSLASRPKINKQPAPESIPIPPIPVEY